MGNLVETVWERAGGYVVRVCAHLCVFRVITKIKVFNAYKIIIVAG